MQSDFAIVTGHYTFTVHLQTPSTEWEKAEASDRDFLFGYQLVCAQQLRSNTAGARALYKLKP